MFISCKTVKNNALRGNIEGLLIGLCVGTALNFFTYGLANQSINWTGIAITYMFSVVISIAIANTVWFAEYLFSKNIKRLWVAVIGYYGGSLLGVAVGHELSYFITSRIYGFKYTLTDHFQSLEGSLAVAVIVCSILFAYQMQRHRYDARISSQELEVIRLKQLKTQAELQTLQSKINPHFLYNSLNSIASLIHDDADKAEDMTLKLSKLFRYSINTQSENLASVKEELEVVKTYLDIELVRFGERMKFSFDLDKNVSNEKIPRFLLQPLVENSLKHGLADKIDGGELTVSIKKRNKMLEVCVGDNGKPFPDELAAGYGLQSTYDKLSLLYQDDYELQIVNTPQKYIRILLPSLI